MPRIKVDIKWDPIFNAFRAYKSGTDEKISRYIDLHYGANDVGKDDPVEAIKTFKDKLVNDEVNKDVILTGWCEIP